MDSKDPLLLILAGQPQLLAKLALRVHLPFRQRAAMRFRMPAMDETHTRGYVEHHLKLAGRRQRLFTDEALLQLFVQSGGIPRAIGNLALASMLNAAVRAKDLVELDDYRFADRGQLKCVRIPSPGNNGKRAKSTVRVRKSDLIDFVEKHYQ